MEGDHVYLICRFTTGDAAGQNMATIATEALCQEIIEASPVKPVYWFLEANLSGDKKASALAFMHGRGRKVSASVLLPKAIVDPNQLENAILNLANNARDAMPRGGKLTIGVDLADWIAEEENDPGAGERAATPYLRIAVTDTGIGMTPETLDRAVEPFFTTKPVGQGTGLGLSMVYGLAKQSRGHLRIYSEPGIGTTVRLYLPVATEAGAGQAAPGDSAGDFAGVSALLVDDDPPVRATTAAILRSLGMTVSEAPNGQEALRILGGATPIDVLVTDVILAGGMLGPEVAERARALRPALKVLFISGFASDALVDHRPLLSKPFRRAELAAEVAKLLGR